jgi:hypothetical protein
VHIYVIGLGGFKLGCTGIGTPSPPIPICEKFDNNSLGNCTCNDQLFINDDCSKVNITICSNLGTKFKKLIFLGPSLCCKFDPTFHSSSSGI